MCDDGPSARNFPGYEFILVELKYRFSLQVLYDTVIRFIRMIFELSNLRLG